MNDTIDATKTNVFAQEIAYMKDKRYQEIAKKLLLLLPDYFFEVPASSTGKYHPQFALGPGGLVRHTKVAMRLAYELFQDTSLTSGYKDQEKDLMLLALLVHDGLKSGLIKSDYTNFDHPLLICDFIKEHQQELELTDNETNYLSKIISSHMGPWNTNDYSNVTLPKPTTSEQRFVHMCDFLASRKFLDVNFDSKNNIE